MRDRPTSLATAGVAVAHRLLTLSVALAALACAGGDLPDPALRTGPDAVPTDDGLHPLDHSGFQLAWARPDVAFDDYRTILLAPPRVAYERPPRRHGGSPNDPNFALSEARMQRFKASLTEALAEELDRSERYAVVDAAGPDTLVILPAIVDLVVLVPTETRPLSETSFSASTARMTLVLDVHDARTGARLARFAERQEARAPSSQGSTALTASSTVNDAAAIRTTFRRWARILRERLDRVQSLGSLAGSPPTPG